MATLVQLKNIAETLGVNSLLTELTAIEKRSQQVNANLILPLVGEFSSGKTTLINALTDSKVLESATEPTTATIYEIHFGCGKCSATITNSDGTQTEASDIHNLKNTELKNASVVTLCDTSTKVPSSTILVDTPGLSSPDPKHKQTLVNFLPSADGVLLVFDINAQFTRSLETFINDMSLVKRPIYVVVTMCETKPLSDREKVKNLFLQNVNNSIKNIAFVSAKTNELDELYLIFDQIQKDKSTILKQVNEQRLSIIAKSLSEYIDNLLNSIKMDSNIDDSIRNQEHELSKLQKNIKRLIDDTSIELLNEERTVTRNFDDIISEKLDVLVSSKSNNFDSEAVASINSTVSLLTSDYCSRIRKILGQKANERLNSAESVSLHSLEEIDLSNTSISGISYDLNLNSLGHEHDGVISTVTKVAGAAVAVAAVVATAGAAASAAGSAAGAAGSAAKGATLAGKGLTAAEGVLVAADVADTVTDVASIVSNSKTASRIETAVNFAGQASQQYANIQNYNETIGDQMRCKKGIVESMVGFVTDKAWGKPQRKKAIRNYVDGTLVPQFKREVERIHRDVLSVIQSCLQQEASSVFQEKKTILEQLKQERNNEKETFDQKVKRLKEFKKLLY